MRKYPAHLRVVLVSCILLVGIIFLPHQTVNAAKFSQVTLRLDRLKANTALSGTLCAIPSSAGAGTEGKVRITFPSDFTISTTATSWTTDTDDLPAGSTAWPGISGTATAASGKTITFTGSDLTSGATRYCFNFQASGSTTGAAGNKVATVTTLTAGNTSIDETDVGIPIVVNDGVTITATVPADPTDFTVTTTKVTPSSLFRENDEIEYEITYGSLLQNNTQLTVEASWGLGTIAGTGTPSVTVAEYIIGSATTGYNGVAPVVDLANRKITWTYSSFPPDTTDETVRFRLRTTSNYTGSSIVSFTTSGRVLGPGTATDYSSISANYQYSNFQPTPIPGPTTTPTAGPGPTATPTPPPTQAPRFDDVNIRTISSNNAEIEVLLSRPGTVTLQYGLSPNAMNERIVSLTPTATHRLEFPDLLENTQYYFRIIITDESGRRNVSDIFTFITAIESEPPKVALESLIATGGNTVLFSSLFWEYTGNKNIIIVPANMVFDVQFAVNAEADIREIFLALRNKNVLGITSANAAQEASSDRTPMLEIKPGISAGRLKSPDSPGVYELFAQITDFNNNLIEEKIAEMKISQPFRILMEGSNKPVENAKVTLSLYDENSQTFEFLSPQKIAVENPVYSEPDGTVPLTLPFGRYRAEIEDLRNENTTIDFVIGPYPGEDYPTVYLTAAPFSFNKTAQYLISTFSDVFAASGELLSRFGSSGRFLELNMLIILACFALLSVFALAERLRIPVRQLPWYFSHILFHHSASDIQKSVFRGKIIDSDTDRPIGGADVYLIDSATGQIILRVTSNNLGKFSFPVLPVFTYHMEIAKERYHEGHFNIHQVEGISERTFVLIKHSSALAAARQVIHFSSTILNISFEFFLLATFLLSIILGLSFGLLNVMPFLFLAGVNLTFWVMHLRHRAFFEEA